MRDPLSPLDEGAILALPGSLEPPCDRQEDPWTGRVRAERPQQQQMIKVVKEPLAVQVQDPVRAPTPLPGDAQGLYCRLARSLALRVRVKMGLQDRLSCHGNPCLRTAIGHRRNP